MYASVVRPSFAPLATPAKHALGTKHWRGVRPERVPRLPTSSTCLGACTLRGKCPRELRSARALPLERSSLCRSSRWDVEVQARRQNGRSWRQAKPLYVPSMSKTRTFPRRSFVFCKMDPGRPSGSVCSRVLFVGNLDMPNSGLSWDNPNTLQRVYSALCTCSVRAKGRCR